MNIYWKHSTFNIQRPMPNEALRFAPWMLNVECWKLNVSGQRRSKEIS